MDDDYPPNEWIEVGTAMDIRGVHLFIRDPESGQLKRVCRVEPEFARRIAENLTLRSFECEDLRREKSSGG